MEAKYTKITKRLEKKFNIFLYLHLFAALTLNIFFLKNLKHSIKSQEKLTLIIELIFGFLFTVIYIICAKKKKWFYFAKILIVMYINLIYSYLFYYSILQLFTKQNNIYDNFDNFLYNSFKIIIFFAVFVSTFNYIKGIWLKVLMYQMLFLQFIYYNNAWKNFYFFAFWMCLNIFVILDQFHIEKKSRTLFKKSYKYKKSLKIITKAIGKMSRGICIISKNKKIVFVNEFFQENILEINVQKEKKVYINGINRNDIEFIKSESSQELSFEEFFTDFNSLNENKNIYEIKNLSNSTKFLIEKNNIYWKNTNCVLLIFEDLDRKKKIINLEESNQFKDDMIASVSHEFRTPLNCIIFMLETFLENCIKISKELKENYLFPALNSAKMLLFLVNDLLDQARITKGNLEISLEDVNIEKLSKEIINLFQIQAKMRNLNVSLEIESSLPKKIESDGRRIRQILINLISNAIKFTKEGYVKLKISKAFEISGISKLKFTVIDTGLGIKPENITKLFNFFGRISDEQEKKLNPEGIGLGLVISNKLIKFLNNDPESKIYVESEFGKGSSFYFYLKYDENKLNSSSFMSFEEFSETSSVKIDTYVQSHCFPEIINRKNKRFSLFQERKNEKNENFILLGSNSKRESDVIFTEKMIDLSLMESSKKISFLKRIDILAADDSEMNQLVLRQMSQKLGFQIEIAWNGKECLEKLEKKLESGSNYHLILMDCEMPVMDGFEATRKIVEKIFKGECEEVNIVGCTAYEDEKNKRKCLDAGMKEVLVKPFTLEKLKKIICRQAKLE